MNGATAHARVTPANLRRTTAGSSREPPALVRKRKEPTYKLDTYSEAVKTHVAIALLGEITIVGIDAKVEMDFNVHQCSRDGLD